MNKKEAEDKVAYLLQQLRSAETKINRMETLAARGESKQRLSFLEDESSQSSAAAAVTSVAPPNDRKEVTKMSDRSLSGSTSNSSSPRDQPDRASTPTPESSSPRQAVSPRPAPSQVGEKEVPPVKLTAEVPKPAPGAAGDRTSLNKYTAFVSGA